jgi:hypothetical protein
VAPLLVVWLIKDVFGGWAVPLWLLAGLGLLWCAAFWPWFRDQPGQMRQVNAAERELIASGRPAVWLLELVDHFLVRFGSSVRQVRDWLGEHGYDLVCYDSAANRLIPAPDPLPASPNVFAVARDRMDEVAARLEGAP